MVQIKTLLFVAGIVVAFFAESWAFLDMTEKLHQHSKEMMKNGMDCAKEVGLSVEEVTSLMMKKTVPETKNGQCFMACMMEKVGLIKDNQIQGEMFRTLGYKMMGEGDMMADLLGDVGVFCGKKNTDEKDKCIVAKNWAQCAMDTCQKFRETLKE